MHDALRHWKQHYGHSIPLHRPRRSRALICLASMDWLVRKVDKGYANSDSLLLPSSDFSACLISNSARLATLLLLERPELALLRAA